MAERIINLNRDWLYRRLLTEYDPATDAQKAKTGLVTAKCYLSLTDTPGTPIAGTTVNPLTEAGVGGRYYGILDALAVTAALATLVNRIVYEICEVPNDYQDVVPLRVKKVEVLA